MKRLILAAVCSLLPHAAFSQAPLSQPQGGTGSNSVSGLDISGAVSTATGSTTARTLQARQAEVINVLDYGAVAGTIGLSDGTIGAGSSALSSASATFSAADVGKSIAISGTGSANSPQIGTITGVTDAHDATVSFTSVNAAPWYQTFLAFPATVQSGSGSYAPADTLTVVGGSPTTAAVFTISTTQVAFAVVNAGGSGGTTGACTVTGTTGTGTKFTATGTVTAGALSGTLVVATPGSYTVNPTSLTAEPVTGCALTGATLTLKTGPLLLAGTTAGHYPATLPFTASTTTTGAGTGATLSITSTQGAGQFTYGPDASAGFAAAVTASNISLAAGTQICIKVPAGAYFIKATQIPTFVRGGCLSGDGSNKSLIFIDPSYAGDVFSWSEAWIGSTYPFGGDTISVSNMATGPQAKGLGIIGERSAANQQNGFMLYDRDDMALFDDLNVSYIAGRALYSGGLKAQAISFLRESHLSNLRFYNDGATGVPAVEFAGQGAGSASNEVRVNHMDIYAPYGTGLMLRTQGNLNNYSFAQIRIEGIEGNSEGIAADLLSVGDGTMTGILSSLSFTQLELIDPYAGFSALKVTAPTSATMPYNLDVKGSIGGGLPYGQGLNILSGRNMRFDMTDISTLGTNVVVGPSPLVGAQIEITGPAGRENSWTWTVDSTAINSILTTPLRIGNPGNPASLGFSLNLHDGTPTGGGAIGVGAIDMQTTRGTTFQIASGAGAILMGGAFNGASGGESAIIGGSSNIAQAIEGFIAGSIQASDRFRASSWAYSSGAVIPNVPGSAEAGRQGLVATGTGAMRLTAQQIAATSAFSPIFNIPNNTAYNLSVRLVAIDRTAPANSYAWTIPIALMTRAASASTTAVAIGTPVILTAGTGSTAAVSLTADTTNGGANLTFTPPTGTDTWDAFADIWSAEVQ